MKNPKTPQLHVGDYIYVTARYLMFRYVYHVFDITEHYVILEKYLKSNKYLEKEWVHDGDVPKRFCVIDPQWFKCRMIMSMSVEDIIKLKVLSQKLLTS